MGLLRTEGRGQARHVLVPRLLETVCEQEGEHLRLELRGEGRDGGGHGGMTKEQWRLVLHEGEEVDEKREELWREFGVGDGD